jgi:hypothetical protein
MQGSNKNPTRWFVNDSKDDTFWPNFACQPKNMKKIHIVMLVGIAAVIAVLISLMGDLSTYETIASAKQKQGKQVTVIAKLDKSMPNPIQYDPSRNANYTSFHVVDSLGNRVKVEYYFEKPFDIEKSERIVLKGRMRGDVFEITRKDGILIKCPSKYKDDPKAAQNNLSQN